METFGSAEIWNLRASFMLVGTDAKADIPLPDNVRRYFFPGVTHGGGRGGFSSAETAADGCELPANPAPSAPMRSALMKAFVAWVTKGAAMPPSRYPTIADGTLVPDTVAAMGFPGIPGDRHPSTRDASAARLRSRTPVQLSGRLRRSHGAVPKVKRSLPQLVVKVDADGNEVAGIKSPLQMAPLGTYTGWNVTASGPLKGQVVRHLRRFHPVRENEGRTAGEAAIRGRRSRSGIARTTNTCRAVSEAASKLVQERYLLQQDADAMIKQAEASDVLR